MNFVRYRQIDLGGVHLGFRVSNNTWAFGPLFSWYCWFCLFEYRIGPVVLVVKIYGNG